MMPTSSPRLSPLHWYSFLVAVGAGSTAVEITGLRLLAPLFGSSLPVWGTAIAIVLAGLAWGYTRGGIRAEQRPSSLLVFQYASLAAALFLWLPAIFRVAAWLRTQWLSTGTVSLLPMLLVLIGAALLIPCFVFGMVTPLAVQIEDRRRGQSAGYSAGRIFTLTTIGSLVGIILPSFFTIPFLGTRLTVWLFAGSILALSLPVLWRQRADYRRQLVAAVAISAVAWWPSQEAGVLASTETAYQHVTVREEPGARLLTFDANLGIQSMITDAIYTNGYWDYLAALPSVLPAEQATTRVLVLGAAGSTTERQLRRFWGETKTFELTSVDLDGELFTIANRYFDPPPRRQVTADARAFVTRDTGEYDLIVVDTYARELTIPFHLTTVEFFAELRQRLAPDGIVAINTNAASPDTLWIKSLARTVQTVLPIIRVTAVPQSCNYLLLAAAAPWPTPPINNLPPAIQPLYPLIAEARIPSTAGMVLTDNRAPTDALGILALMDDASGCGG